jgi:hypothetical protein
MNPRADATGHPPRSRPALRLVGIATALVLSLCAAIPPALASPNPPAPAAPAKPAARLPGTSPAKPTTSKPVAPATSVAGGTPVAPGTSVPAPPASTADPSAQVSSLPGPGPLVANGLGSPSCTAGQQAGLSSAARANCAASGLVAAPAPIDNYQFDIHIDLPLVGGLKNDLATLVQDFILTPVWMALVWVTDVLVVALEWCYSINLLGTGTLGPVTSGLASMHRALTTPWLATVLAIAAVTFLYNGLIRRRIVETLGQFALMLAMMIGGLWVIIDPADTVGAVSQLANQASLGVLAASATGDPSQPARSLDDGLRQVFDAAVGTPWCYLEFGNVAWCDDPGQLDPDLRATARQIALIDTAGAKGKQASLQAQTEVAALAAAKTNGALFLALPANGAARNSIQGSPLDPSLLSTLCGSVDDTSCIAPTAPEAEFRTENGTIARIGGLLLIAVGELGMFGFLGFLALRLLSSALLALLYLLLAPVAVLAPALGDGGRALFRLWSLRLLGSVIAKLIYSVFLGVALLMLRVLGQLGSLGWWTQWLLIASFWWIVFNHRHQLLEHVIHERGESTRRASLGNRLFAAHQAMRLARPVAKVVWRKARSVGEAGRALPGGTRQPRPPKPPSTGRRSELDQQVSRTLERDHALAASTLAGASGRERELAELRDRRQVLKTEHRTATLAGDRRRAASLAARTQRVDGQIKNGEHEIARARATVRRGEENIRQTGIVHDADQRARHAAFLDQQAELRPRLAEPRDKRRGQRDYAELAPLAGHRRAAYETLSASQRRPAELEIDRALEHRRDWSRETRVAEREQARTAKRQKRPREPTARPQPARPEPAPLTRRQRQFDLTQDRSDARRARSTGRAAPRGQPPAVSGPRDSSGRSPREPGRPPRDGSGRSGRSSGRVS